MRPVVVWVVLGLALVLAAGDAWAGAHAGNAQAEQAKEKWSQIAEEKREAGLAKAEQHRLFARFSYDEGGNASGRFVSFHFAEPSGAIHDFEVMDGNVTLPFFDAIDLSSYVAGDDPFVTGAVLRVYADGLTIRAHNNPTALVSWTNEEGSQEVRFTLAANATAGNVTGKEVRVLVGGNHGHILVNGNASLEGGENTVTARLGAGEKVMFRAHPTQAAGAASTMHDVNDAFKAGNLGAVVSVAEGQGAPIVDDEAVDVDVDATQVGEGALTLTAEATASTGRILFVGVSGAILDPGRPDAIVVQLNGAAVSRVANASAAMGSSGAAVAVLPFPDESNVQLVIRVPQFSVQTITVQQAEPDDAGPTTAKTTPGVGLAGLLGVALAGAWGARRRR